jgi:uncharacterized membrane protein YhhN
VSRPARLAGVVGLLAAAVHFAAMAFDWRLVGLVSKPLPALALAGWVLARGSAPLRRPVALGLVLSALGDVQLELGRFLPGLVSFLAAHVAYLWAFMAAERRPALLRLVPFFLWGALALHLLRPGLGTMFLPVAVYIAVICTMMWRAAARVGPGGHAALLGLAGALAFGASDTLIAFDRFHAPIPEAGWLIMALYWLGQSGIAASACVMLRGHGSER